MLLLIGLAFVVVRSSEYSLMYYNIFLVPCHALASLTLVFYDKKQSCCDNNNLLNLLFSAALILCTILIIDLHSELVLWKTHSISLT